MMDASEISSSLAEVVRTAGAAVVRVEARRRGPASGILWDEGVVLTADHVVEDDEGAKVGLPDGRVEAVREVRRDEASDLAVLSIAPGPRPTLVAADDAALAVGQLVLAVARPGRTVRASLGVLSAVADSWRTPAGSRIERYLESDVGLRSGLSGSALVDVTGRLVGMTTSGLVRGARVCLPVATLRRLAGELLAKGRVQRGYLGVSTVPVRLPPAMAAASRQDAALLVVGVQEGSPAERAGVLLGDAIVALHGTKVSSLGELMDLLGEEHAGQASRLGILRAGEPRELAVEIGSRAA